MRLGVPGVSARVVHHLWLPFWYARLSCFRPVVAVDKRRVDAVYGMGFVVLYSCAFLASTHSWRFISGWHDHPYGIIALLRW